MKLFFSILFLCGSSIISDAQSFKTLNIVLDTTRLEHNFEIVGAIDTTEVFVYEQLLLKHNNKAILFDNATTYFFQEQQYPILIKTGANNFELLLETDGRPHSNTLTHLKFKNDTLIERNNLPIFISRASNLDNDSTLEYAGCIGFFETDIYVPYNPIIYYELRPDGIRVDSTLSADRNTAIYGAFHGYEYREDFHQPLNGIRLYNEEIKRIRAAK